MSDIGYNLIRIAELVHYTDSITEAEVLTYLDSIRLELNIPLDKYNIYQYQQPKPQA